MAADLRVGDTLRQATGPVTVLRIESAHGGLEILVRPADGEEDRAAGSSERLLWFWRNQPVYATHADASCGQPTPPGAAISRREESRQAAAKRKAQRDHNAR